MNPFKKTKLEWRVRDTCILLLIATAACLLLLSVHSGAVDFLRTHPVITALAAIPICFALYFLGSRSFTAKSALITVMDLGIIVLIGCLIWFVYELSTGAIQFSDASGQMSSIYALITFTITLSALIPYIIGRTIAESTIEQQVNEKVSRLFNERIHRLEESYNASLSSLKKNSGHTSRMMAKMAITDLSPQKNKQESFAWVIGLASQGMIKYLQARYENTLFYADCLQYIKQALDELKKEQFSFQDTDVSDTPTNRAFRDLMDFWLLYNHLPHNLNLKCPDEKNAIRTILQEFYRKRELEYFVFHSKYFDYIEQEDLDDTTKRARLQNLLRAYRIMN